MAAVLPEPKIPLEAGLVQRVRLNMLLDKVISFSAIRISNPII